MTLRRPEACKGKVLSVYTKAPYIDKQTKEVKVAETDICQLLVSGFTGSDKYIAEVYEILEFKIRNGHSLPQYQKLVGKTVEVHLNRTLYPGKDGRPAESYQTINGLFPKVIDDSKITSLSSSFTTVSPPAKTA